MKYIEVRSIEPQKQMGACEIILLALLAGSLCFVAACVLF